MAQHVRLLGILHIVFGSVGVFAGLVVLLVFGSAIGLISSGGHDDARIAIPFVGVVGSLVALVIMVVSVPGIVGGVGLLKPRPWGRSVLLFVSALELLHLPLGTALGIYGLWALLNPETERMFA